MYTILILDIIYMIFSAAGAAVCVYIFWDIYRDYRAEQLKECQFCHRKFKVGEHGGIVRGVLTCDLCAQPTGPNPLNGEK